MFISTSNTSVVFTELVLLFNPLRAKFSRWNKTICFYFMSFLRIHMTQVVEIIPQERQELTYSTQLISCQLMATQGARASATMILTMLNRINFGPHTLSLNNHQDCKLLNAHQETRVSSSVKGWEGGTNLLPIECGLLVRLRR